MKLKRIEVNSNKELKENMVRFLNDEYSKEELIDLMVGDFEIMGKHFPLKGDLNLIVDRGAHITSRGVDVRLNSLILEVDNYNWREQPEFAKYNDIHKSNFQIFNVNNIKANSEEALFAGCLDMFDPNCNENAKWVINYLSEVISKTIKPEILDEGGSYYLTVKQPHGSTYFQNARLYVTYL